VPHLSVWAILRHFCGAHPGFRGQCFHLLISSSKSPAYRDNHPCQELPDLVGLRGGSFCPGKPKGWVPVAQGNPERLGNQHGSPDHQSHKNLGPNSGLLQEAEGEYEQFPKTPKLSPFLRWSNVFQVQGAGWNYCAVWESVKVWTWDVPWLQSFECRVLIHRYRSRVSPNRVPGPGLIWTY
jgi:hypothetical protein